MNPVPRRTPRAQARAEEQRERILDVAQKCFVENGLHGPSMALIAQSGGISIGLAYRYFESKNAIMLGIVARELERARKRLDQVCASTDHVTQVLAGFRDWQLGPVEGMSAALFLEMSAAASRSPEISAAVRQSDSQVRGLLVDWLQRDPAQGGMGLPAERAGALSLLLQCFFDGLLVRAVREPDLDAATLRPMLEQFFTQLGMVPTPTAAAAPQE